MNPLDPNPDVRYPALAAMRSACPVHSLAPGRHLALDHASVGTGLRSIEAFGGSAGQEGLAEEDTMISGILEPRHGAVRRIINSVVAFHKSQRIEPYLAAFVADRLEEVLAAAAEGPVDVMPTFVEPLPPAAMARLLGFPEAESSRYFAWGAQLGQAFGEAAAAGRSISMRDANPEMAGYVEKRIEERRAMPEAEWPNDALTRFLTTEVDGERLSDRAITTQVMFMIGAGSETTRNTLGSLLYRLARDPELYARVRADRTLVEPAIEEALRIESPAQFMVRQCLDSGVELGGSEIPKGDTVLMSIAAANRDDAVFPRPDEFDVERPNLRDHLGFGTGPHICPGGALARLEMTLALSAWCDAVRHFELAPGFAWEPPPTGMLHGPKHLPLVIHPVG